jgi:septal ring factor EnvC (AmiA/AmiB activator)
MKEYGVPLLAVLGTFVTAFLTYLGVRYTQRQVAKATEQQTKLEQTKVDADAYGRARDNYEAALDTLRDQVKDLQDARRTDHSEVEQLKRRIEDLERFRRADRTTIQQLSAYIRALLRLLREAGITPPPPPVALSDTDPTGWTAS